MTLLKRTPVALALLLAFSPFTYAAPSPVAAPTVARDVLPAGAYPERYQISVDPDLAKQQFHGELVLSFQATQALPALELNGIDLEVINAELDGKAVTAEILADSQRIRFNSRIKPGKHQLKVSYRGKIYEQSAGLFVTDYRKADGSTGQMLSSQFEPGDARKLAPMWDEPSHKAVFDISLVEGKDLFAVSNMPEISRTLLADGRSKVQFAPTAKMSSYLLYVGMGDYERISGRSGGVEHGVITKRGDVSKGAYALGASYQLLDYYNDYFGVRYPLPKLDHLAVPGAGGFSAMENWGAVMYFEGALLLDPQFSTVANKQNVFITVAHEMAHQWFGNLVTMQWWDDLWLNEGFASWMENKATQHFNPEWNMALESVGSRNYAMYQDAQQTTHPIVQQVRNIEEANAAFDGITYSKGLAVITMIEAYVGEDAFRQGVRAYMQQHKYGNTVTQDLWSALETASGKPVRQIAKDFTGQPGVPLLTVKDSRCEAGNTIVTVQPGRFGLDVASRENLSWTIPVVARVQGGALQRLELTGNQAQPLQLKGCGLVELNAGQTGYYRVQYSAEALAGLTKQFASLPLVDQFGLLKDVAALTSAEYEPISDYLTLVQHARDIDQPQLQQDIAGQLTGYDSYYDGKPTQMAYRQWALGLLNKWFANVGWQAKANESDNTALLRSSLIGALADLGDQPTLKEARRRYLASNTQPAELPAALRSTVLRILGRYGDANDFATLRAQAKQTTNSTEQRTLLFALAGTKDKTLASQVLQLALSDETPKQYAPNMINRVANSHTQLAYDFYQANQAAIEQRLDPLRRAGFDASLLNSGTEASTQTLLLEKAANASSKPVKTAYEQAAAAVGRRIERSVRIPAEIDRFLDKNG